MLPAVTTSAARIKVQADGNIFFAISPGNFSVAPPLNPVVQPLQCANGAVRLTWSALPGRSYRVQYKPSMAAATWSDLLPSVIATGSTVAVTDTPGQASQRYYRVVLLP